MRDDVAGVLMVGYALDVCGFAYAGSGGRAVIYNGGSFRFVDPFLSGFGEAADVNNLGHAAGYTEDASGGVTQAFVFDGQTSRVIGGITGTNTGSVAYAINDQDQVVGDSVVEIKPPQGVGSSHHASLYSAGEVQDLGTLGGVFSFAQDISGTFLRRSKP